MKKSPYCTFRILNMISYTVKLFSALVQSQVVTWKDKWQLLPAAAGTFSSQSPKAVKCCLFSTTMAQTVAFIDQCLYDPFCKRWTELPVNIAWEKKSLPVCSSPGLGTLSSEDKNQVNIYDNWLLSELRPQACSQMGLVATLLQSKLYSLSIKATGHRYHDTHQLLRWCN